MAYNTRDVFDGVSRTVSWLSREWAKRFRFFLGVHFDMLYEAIGLAIKTGHLRSPDSPPDALPMFASERQLERAPGQTDAEFREHLADAWEVWADAGQKGGSGEQSFAQRALEFFAPGSTITVFYEPQTGWSGPNPEYWSYCWIKISGVTAWSYPRASTSGLVCGHTTATCGSSATYDEVQLVRTMVRRLKAGHEIPVAIIHDFRGRLCGGGGLCGTGLTSGPLDCVWHLAHYAGQSTNPVTAGGAHRWTLGKPALCGAIV